VAAPNGALWLRSQASVARFDPSLADADSPDAAWTVYSSGTGVEDASSDPLAFRPGSAGFGPIAFGPGGEVWFGATRFDPALAAGGPSTP
jgi:hypothetical protein